MIAIGKNITKVLYSPLFSLDIFRALKNCLIAHARTYSGTSSAQTNNGSRCSVNDSSGFNIRLSIQPFATRFFGDGTFGWTAIQVHENIVTRQLQIMFQIDLQCERSVQWFGANEQLLTDGTGSASIEAHWMM